MYLVNILAPESSSTEWLQPLSLFHYYGISPLADGLDGERLLVFGLAALVSLAAGWVAFARRDIGR